MADAPNQFDGLSRRDATEKNIASCKNRRSDDDQFGDPEGAAIHERSYSQYPKHRGSLKIGDATAASVLRPASHGAGDLAKRSSVARDVARDIARRESIAGRSRNSARAVARHGGGVDLRRSATARRRRRSAQKK